MMCGWGGDGGGEWGGAGPCLLTPKIGGLLWPPDLYDRCFKEKHSLQRVFC